MTANTGALLALLLMALTFNRKLSQIALLIILVVGGGLVWLLGSPQTVHIGASGVIFGLIGFLLFVGLFHRDLRALLTSVAVFLFYGGVLLGGFIPMAGVSWSGHIFGFLSGILAAWLTKPTRRRPPANVLQDGEATYTHL